MTKKIQMMSHDKEWQVVDGVETLVPVEQFDIDPITDSSCVKIEGFRTLEETLNEKNMFTPEVNATKVMDKVGGEYHQNVVDGAYEEAILYGNTQVNLCEEDTNVALQIPTTFTSFNNGELQINNKENQVVAPLIKGVTMVNLAQERSATFDTSNSYVVENVKGNTTYTVFFNFTVKNTNAGIIIQSYNGNTYLENSIHKTQLGDKVKFTFTTHSDANRFSICNPIAYGGQTIQLDDIMTIEGDQTALDIPYFKGMKSVELVRPLTNLFANDTPTAHSFTNVTNNNGQVTATSQSSAAWTYACFNITFKSNTSYIVMWDSLSYTQTGNANQTIAICYGNDIIANIDNNFTNKRSIIFNTGDRNPSDINLRIHTTTKNTETGTTTVTGLRVFEYDDYLRSVDLQSIGWFSGTKNVAVEPIKTCSKNLYPYGDINFTPTSTGWYDAKGNSQMTGDIASKSHSRFLLEKGTYYFSIESNTNAFCQLTDDKENMGVNANSSFTLQEDKYVTLRVKVTTANTSTTVTNIQIERGETATDYVAHDSRYYEPNGQNAIVLRSLPDGMYDTFNIQTGEYIQRVGEVVLDGSADETWQTIRGSDAPAAYVEGYVSAYTYLDNFQVGTSTRLINDKGLPRLPYANTNSEGLFYLNAYIGRNALILRIDESKVNNSIREYLQTNPITIQYQLTTPITTIIPRTIKRNNNGAVSTIDFGTYTNKESLVLPKNPTFLTINSMTSIKPVVEPITYVDFKTRLKANTDYSVKLDKNTDSQLSFKIGGVGTKGTYFTMNSTEKQKIAKTPTLDVSNVLRISGNGSIQNIMVIEGDVLDKELPYFNGMCNVKMPIVRNTCKNLCNFDEHKTNWWVGSGGLFKGDGTANNYSVIIPASVDNYYMISMIGTDRNIYGFLDKDYNVIYLDAGYKNITIKAPSNTRYLIWYLSSTGLTKENNIMITASKSSSMTTVPYEPYRCNDICIVKNGQTEITLSQDMFEQGGVDYPVTNTITYEQGKANSTVKSSTRLRNKKIFKINGGKTYKLALNDSEKRYQWYLWRQDGKSLGITGGWSDDSNTFTVTVPQEAAYMSLLFKKANNSDITVNELNLDYFQLLELDSAIQLRSLPNGVKDELNLLTGEYIQRVGEIVLNGKNNQFIEGLKEQKGDYLKFGIQLNPVAPYNHNVYLLNDRFNSETYSTSKEGQQEQIYIHTHSSTNTELRVCILPSKLSTPDNVGFNSYLQSNPITVQYELAEPIISYPRIVSNTQEREVGVKLPNGVVDTYNPSTGITVKRVGKTILDGNEKWSLATTKTNTQVFGFVMSDMAMTQNNLYCETMMVVSGKDVEAIGSLDGTLYIALLKTKASTVDELKTYLASNPVTVWYDLKYPIVTTDIVLPNGVHDEYNPLTGLYTKRVGLIEFDGSDDENWSLGVPATGTDVNQLFLSPCPQAQIISKKENCNIICDKLPYLYELWNTDQEGVHIFSNPTRIAIRVTKSKLTEVSLVGLKQYLSQNPLRVWYELATPITYQLTPYFGLPMPYAYKDGYLIMDSAYNGQTLPPEIKYKLLANRTGQITQNNIKLQNHTSKLSNLEAMLVEATLQSMYEREMMAFNLEMVNINLINLEE